MQRISIVITLLYILPLIGWAQDTIRTIDGKALPIEILKLGKNKISYYEQGKYPKELEHMPASKISSIRSKYELQFKGLTIIATTDSQEKVRGRLIGFNDRKISLAKDNAIVNLNIQEINSYKVYRSSIWPISISASIVSGTLIGLLAGNAADSFNEVGTTLFTLGTVEPEPIKKAPYVIGGAVVITTLTAIIVGSVLKSKAELSPQTLESELENYRKTHKAWEGKISRSISNER